MALFSAVLQAMGLENNRKMGKDDDDGDSNSSSSNKKGGSQCSDVSSDGEPMPDGKYTHEEGASVLIQHGLAKVKFDREAINDKDVQKKWGEEACLAVGRLRQHLMVYMNDDILAGTFFAPTDMTTDTPDGAPGLVIRIKKSADAAAGGDGDSVVFPCTGKQAAALYSSASQAPLGIEGKGDVVDLAKRKAREILAADLELPPCLHGDRLPFAFPQQVQSIHQRLLPAAERIEFEPYKLNVYAPGDHFIAHRDAVHDDTTWGTLVVHLPCIGDFLDPAFAGRSPDRFSYWSNEEADDWDNEDDDRENDDTIDPRFSTHDYHNAYGQKDNKNGSDDDDDGDEIGKTCDQDNRRADGGALRFYIGRGVEVSDQTEVEKFERGFGSYEPSNRASSMYCASVLMQNYTAAEVGRGALDETTVNSFANVLAMPRRRERPDGAAAGDDDVVSGPTTLSKTFNRLAALKPGDKRTALPLHFAAFHTTLLHDVRPLKAGHRVTLTYKIRRSGKLSIPRVSAYPELSRLVDHTIELLIKSQMNRDAIEKRNEKAANGDANAAAVIAKYGATSPAVGLGICLRHAYPAGLIKTGKCLRGVDLLLWSLISEKFESVLCAATTVRTEYEGRPFIINHDLRRECILTADSLDTVGFDTNDYLDRGIQRVYPMTNDKIAFLDVGLGTLYAGGCVTGNCDCALDFYTRNAVLVTTLKPTRWMRRRDVFLIVEKGDEKAHPLVGSLRRISKMYAPFRNICYFL